MKINYSRTLALLAIPAVIALSQGHASSNTAPALPQDVVDKFGCAQTNSVSQKKKAMDKLAGYKIAYRNLVQKPFAEKSAALSSDQQNSIRGEMTPLLNSWTDDINTIEAVQKSGYVCTKLPDFQPIVAKLNALLASAAPAVDPAAPVGKVDPRIAQMEQMKASKTDVEKKPQMSPLDELRDAVLKDAQPNRFVKALEALKPTNLDLGRLGLKALPAWFSSVNLGMVRTLDLSQNQLENLQGLENMRNLQYLNVGSNKLTSFNGIQTLQNLKGLYAQQNQLGAERAATSDPRVSDIKFLPQNIEEIVLDDNSYSGYLPQLNYATLKYISIKRNPGLTGVCWTTQEESPFPYVVTFDPMGLAKLELNGTNLDGVSKQCLQELVKLRKAHNIKNPIQVMMD